MLPWSDHALPALGHEGRLVVGDALALHDPAEEHLAVGDQVRGDDVEYREAAAPRPPCSPWSGAGLVDEVEGPVRPDALDQLCEVSMMSRYRTSLSRNSFSRSSPEREAVQRGVALHDGHVVRRVVARASATAMTPKDAVAAERRDGQQPGQARHGVARAGEPAWSGARSAAAFANRPSIFSYNTGSVWRPASGFPPLLRPGRAAARSAVDTSRTIPKAAVRQEARMRSNGCARDRLLPSRVGDGFFSE